ncbi:hypothetical protein [Amycolatopsis sp. EV170708-02-1]|uniref:hypothetical protein n=1 Tax=Amycolatopsis sp. EV170708-02-1 TaxID=2919322 RepID=UPI001F0C1700|nr:hypothetical protein [Amycolatopsis sp. EV170708-02-1]UMP02011.1 hypothetical protein MJQ72_37295 [Amycolatopsis sp. EV170708-02-1]
MTVTRRRSRPGDPFPRALDRAITESGLGLDRIRHRLAQQGVRISVATLSYWRTGRSRPSGATP